MTLRAFFAAIVLSLTIVVPAMAQNASLLADHVAIDGNSTVTATGNIEVFYEDTRLKASRIIYNRDDDTLIIEGPITLIEGKKSFILADSAELSADLRNGILRGARLVLDQQLQLAAAEISRVDGRYTQLYKTVASSCQVCAKNPIPLWQIRARKIVHDDEKQQLYFEDAAFVLANVPIFYFPRLRFPDPSLRRANGLLVPVYRGSSRLGSGIKVPYFITLGDHADLTFSPYLSPKTRTLEARYRQVFRTGNIEFNGAISSDDLHRDTRTYLFGEGEFDLPRGFDLTFGLQLTSDPRYLNDYGYSNKDRLENRIGISHTQDTDFFRAEVLTFKPLRGNELIIEDQLPNLQGELHYEKRFFPSSIGGQGKLELSANGYQRKSNVDQIGRDGTRIGARVDWGRNYAFGPGVLAHVGGTLGADFYNIQQDQAYKNAQKILTPGLAAELRWPLVKSSAKGVAMVLEPVVQLAWSDTSGGSVPNEDSTLVEFDQGNLLSISRFPGHDRFERGFRAATGVKWSRYDPKGWSMDFTLGRIFRDEDLNQFTRASGLDGKNSNWLAATHLSLTDNLSVIARAQIDNNFLATKAETRATWVSRDLALTASYTWMIADAAENRPDQTTQLGFDGSYSFARNWYTKVNMRYDFAEHSPTRTAFLVRYTTECINIDLSLSRRFRSSTRVSPDTDFGFSVSLRGFGSNGRANRGTCSG